MNGRAKAKKHNKKQALLPFLPFMVQSMDPGGRVYHFRTRAKAVRKAEGMRASTGKRYVVLMNEVD